MTCSGTRRHLNVSFSQLDIQKIEAKKTNAVSFSCEIGIFEGADELEIQQKLGAHGHSERWEMKRTNQERTHCKERVNDVLRGSMKL